MQHRSVIKPLRPRAAIVVLLIALLPALSSRIAVASDHEKPIITNIYANAPGMITIIWSHSGEGVFWFVLEQESPPAVNQIDRDKRGWSVLNLQPSTTYRYRVCAVFAYNRRCSDEDGVGYASVTTMPPERVAGGRPPASTPSTPPPAPAPKALYSPVIRAWPNRLVAGGVPVVQLKWVNPVDATQFALLKRMDWYRDGKYFNSSTTPEMQDMPKATHRYKLCVENAISKICSAEIIAGSGGVAASFESINFPRRYIRHRNSLGEVTPVNNNLDSEDIAFFVRPGLSDAPHAVSFESVNYRGHFLRHQGYRIKLHRSDGTDLFRKDSTFTMRPGLRNLPDLVSFESVNHPGHFIRHQNFELWIVKNDGSNLFHEDATFRQTDHYVGHLEPPVPVLPYVPSYPSSSVVKPVKPGSSASASAIRNTLNPTCKSGFVWRVARADDLVCVTVESRRRVAEENRTAASRAQAGSSTCRSGYVWREAFDGDTVCVTPQIRALVREENQLGPSRRAQ